MRVPCPREGGHQCCVAAQCPAIGSGAVDDKVEAPTVLGWDAGSGCVGEPLLWHDLAFGSYGLARHADPGALNHLCTSGQHASKLGHGRLKGPWLHHIQGWGGWGKEARAGEGVASTLFAWLVAGCLVARHSCEPRSGTRPCLGVEQCARTGRQGRQKHAIAIVYGKGPRCVVLPAVRPVPGTRGRWRGRTGSFEQHTPCRAIAPALVLQGSAFAASARQRAPSPASDSRRRT